ncbi:MAG: transposase [Roseitalea sp.]|nr:transposase [Roseitalea sp.]MBO6721633.1 transposase [Roseitalea sp.]MBO6743389.1 transposase [Roseitalea sp.]
MKRSRFSEEQIIAMLKEQESGVKTADVCRRHGISEATLGSSPRAGYCTSTRPSSGAWMSPIHGG